MDWTAIAAVPARNESDGSRLTVFGDRLHRAAAIRAIIPDLALLLMARDDVASVQEALTRLALVAACAPADIIRLSQTDDIAESLRDHLPREWAGPAGAAAIPPAAPRRWQPDEVPAMHSAITLLALAIRRRDEREARLAAGQRRAMLLDAVARASEALTRITDLRVALHEAGRILVAAVGVSRMTVFRWEPSERSAYLFAESCAPGIESCVVQFGSGPFAFADFEEVFVPLMAGRLYSSPLHEKTGRNAELNSRSLVKTDIFTPVFIGARFWGMLCLDDTVTERAWTDEEIVPLRAATEAVAAAVRRSELEVELRRASDERAREFARANAILQRCFEPSHADDDPTALLQRVAMELRTLLRAETATVTQLAGSVDGTRPTCAFDGTVWARLGPEYVSWDEPIAAAVGTDVLLACARTPGQPIGEGTRRYMHERGLDWLATVVVSTEQVTSAVLSVFGRGEPAFAQSELTLVRTLAHQATLALRLSHLAHSARRAAIIEERNRLARDIHDTLSQGLSGIAMQCSALRTKLGTSALPVQQELDRIERLAREHLTEARRSIAMLRPMALDDELLAGALRRAIDATEHPGITLLALGAPVALPAEVEVELFRIGEAALANAVQHAQASAIDVELSYQRDGSVRLAVADDGCGFDPAVTNPGRFGLLGMSERAARASVTLSLVTAPDEGTEVVAIWRPAPPHARPG